MPSKDDMRGITIIDMDLASLANLTAVQQVTIIDAARLQGCVPTHLEFVIEFVGKPTATGPLVYGVAETLSNTEIAQWFTADPQHSDEPAASEISKRHLLILGYIGKQATTSLGSTSQGVGTMLEPKLKTWPGWHVIEGEAWNFFVFNFGVALTGNTLLDGYLKHRGSWIDK